MNWKILTLSSITIIFWFLLVSVSSRSNDYYEMVEDFESGLNYYKLLGVKEDSTAEEIRRNFRKLALLYHPDKSVDPNATEKYAKINFAYQILSESSSRNEYNKLLREGVPWEEKYYGQFAHRMGAPDHDPRWVVGCFLAFATACQYLYWWYRYFKYREMIIQTPRYQHLLNGYKKKQKEKKKQLKKNKENQSQEEEEVVLPEIEIVGAEKPKIRDLFIVHMVIFPWTLACWIYQYLKWFVLYDVLGYEKPFIDEEKLAREKAGMTKEEWEKNKRRLLEKAERDRTSAKAKRMRRFLKNRVSEFYDGDD